MATMAQIWLSSAIVLLFCDPPPSTGSPNRSQLALSELKITTADFEQALAELNQRQFDKKLSLTREQGFQAINRNGKSRL
jgi:hypothetical protein